jgi:hypothetical protein
MTSEPRTEAMGNGAIGDRIVGLTEPQRERTITRRPE